MAPYTLLGPAAPAIALVCDSPHSGTWYPDDYRHVVPREQLRGGEDTHVETLWEAVPTVGGTLLAAHFPRTYIDANRTLDDLDPELLAEPWPQPLAPGPKSRLGFGLVWRNLRAGVPIYDRLLSVAEVQHRIDAYYKPYHAALAEAIAQSVQRFGAVWHLNLHSMPNDAYERLGIASETSLADFVLGDRDGTTSEPEFVGLIESFLLGKGYTVARNDPYKGVQLIARMGAPEQRRHSLQIEIRRPLYMNELTRERNDGFSSLQRDLTDLLHVVGDYVRSQAGL